MTVAVVGASFAGLSVARALQQQGGRRRFRVVLLEAENARRYVDRENGEVNLHGLDAGLLRDLGLERLHAGLVRSPARPHYVQRSELLRGLVESLEPSTLRHDQCVKAVQGSHWPRRRRNRSRSRSRNKRARSDSEEEEKEEKGFGGDGFTLRVESVGDDSDDDDSDDDSDDGPSHGYDLKCDRVVLAYGLSAATESLVRDGGGGAARRVLLAGDARVQLGFEAFFGWRRFNYGVTTAMADGLRVAKLIMDETNDGNDDNDDGRVASDPFWSRHSVERWQRTRRWRRAVIPKALLLLVLAAIVTIIHRQQK